MPLPRPRRVAGKALAAIVAVASYPWLGIPVRWVLPLVAAAWSPAVLPVLATAPTARLWVAVATWVAIRFMVLGPVTVFILVYLFLASLGHYIVSIAGPIVFDRGQGLVQSGRAAVASPDPGLLYVISGVRSIASGPGIPWLSAVYMAIVVALFCTTGPHVYYDFEDFFSFRFNVRAPLWTLVVAAAAGSLLAESYLPLGGLLHLVAAVAGAALAAGAYAVLAALWAACAAASRALAMRLGKRRRRAAGAVPAGPASVRPTEVTPAASFAARSIPSAPRTSPPPTPVPPVPAAGVAPVPPDASLPPPGRLPGAVPAAHDPYDGGVLPAAVDTGWMSTMQETGSRPFDLLRFHLEFALDERDPAALDGLLSHLSALWATAASGDPAAREALALLTFFGSFPLGRTVFSCLRDGVDGEVALDQLLSSRFGGDDVPDPAWVLDEGLRPGPRPVSVAFGSGEDIPDFPPRSPAVAPSAEDPLDWDDAWSSPGPGFVRTTAADVVFSDARPVVPAAVVPAAAAAIEERWEPGILEPVVAVVPPDPALGVGESGSEETLHPFETSDELAVFVSHVAPLPAAEVFPLFAVKWLPQPAMVVSQLAAMIHAMTPDAGSLAEFMDSVGELAGKLSVVDPHRMWRLLLGLVAMDESVPDAERVHRARKVAYALCGPWRRGLHATVGSFLARGEGFVYDPVADVDALLEHLLASSDDVVEMFPSYDVEGSAATAIAARRDRLAALRRGIGVANSQRGPSQSREESRIVGRGMALRAGLDPAAEIHFQKVERLASIMNAVQDVISRDSVLGTSNQVDHPLRVVQRDVLAEGGAAIERIDAAVAAYRARARVAPETAVLEHILEAMPVAAREFVDDARRAWSDPFKRPTPTRDILAALSAEVAGLREAEAQRVAAARMSPREQVEAAWSGVAADPFDSVSRRKALEDETILSDPSSKPEWAMVQVREFGLPSGLRVFIHDSGVPPDVRRVMLVPVFGAGLVWTVDADGLVPIGSSYVRVDLRRFVEDHQVVLRSQRIADVKVLLASATLSPDIEDVVLSSRLDRDRELSRDAGGGHWWRGCVVLPADMVGSRGGVGLPGGMYFELADLGRQSARASA